MSLYEHIFLVRQEASPQQVEALTDRFKNIIVDGGGSIGKVEQWGLRACAYRIRKNRKAHYVLMDINAPHSAVAEMERIMGLTTDVLRFMTIKVEAHSSEPSVMMKNRDDRGDRRGSSTGNTRPPRHNRDDNNNNSNEGDQA